MLSWSSEKKVEKSGRKARQYVPNALATLSNSCLFLHSSFNAELVNNLLTSFICPATTCVRIKISVGKIWWCAREKCTRKENETVNRNSYIGASFVRAKSSGAIPSLARKPKKKIFRKILWIYLSSLLCC